jgi:hypothetical protein
LIKTPDLIFGDSAVLAVFQFAPIMLRRSVEAAALSGQSRHRNNLFAIGVTTDKVGF